MAPPGNDDRVGGIAFTVALELPLPLGCLLLWNERKRKQKQFNANSVSQVFCFSSNLNGQWWLTGLGSTVT